MKPDFRAKEGIVTMAAKPTYEHLEQRIRLLEEASIKYRQTPIGSGAIETCSSGKMKGRHEKR